MHDRPLVSIIIPCFNNEAYVAEAIESALSQTYENVEVIVVDDGSTDGGGAIIDTYADRAKVLHQANAGACTARNRGLAEAEGEWIKFLDADDILMADCVERQMVSAAGRDDVIVFGDCEFLYSDGSTKPDEVHARKNGLKKGDRAALRVFLFSYILTVSTLYPRRILLERGSFAPQVRRGQEKELHARLYLAGVEFEYYPGICFQYREHDSPTRISNALPVGEHSHKIENFRALVQLARSGSRSAELVKIENTFAKYAWYIGRQRLNLGDRALAERFFAEGVELAGRLAVEGRMAYRLAVRIVGPLSAERLNAFARTARRFWKR